LIVFLFVFKHRKERKAWRRVEGEWCILIRRIACSLFFPFNHLLVVVACQNEYQL